MDFEITTSAEEMAEKLNVPVESITRDSERKNIFAYTPFSLDGSPPPYLSVNLESDESITVTLRGPGFVKKLDKPVGHIPTDEIVCNEIASMAIPKEQLLFLFVGIGSFIYGDDIMCEAAGWFLNKALEHANVVEDVKMTAVAMPAPANDTSAPEPVDDGCSVLCSVPDPE